MKRKFIMMPVLIQGPKQPDNDIDVYLRPLVEELFVGVRSMKNKNFLPHANKQAKIYLLDCSNESME